MSAWEGAGAPVVRKGIGLTAVTLEHRRAAELGRYAVLRRPPRRELVALADIAARVAGVPMASINLIDDVEQHQVVTAGSSWIVCAREEAMCNVVLHEVDPVIVEDASVDPRFCNHPFVTGVYHSVRFYAAHQLRTPSGVVIGMLCAFDTEPRTLDEQQRRALSHLADRVVDVLELELRTRQLERRTAALSAAVTELQRTRQELQRSNDNLTAFAGQVSHDLRNPLTAVSGSLALLEDLTEDPDPRLKVLGSVVSPAARAARRMEATIEDLLEFARVGGQLTISTVDLAEVITEAREDLGSVLTDVTVVLGDLPVVHGDRVQLRAVLQNLLSNAAKFRQPGRPQQVEIGARRQGACWRITVRDHGLGIPVEVGNRIFEPLVRAHLNVPGTGLGLATVARIIAAHGGRFGTEETPGGGATLWFDLPD